MSVGVIDYGAGNLGSVMRAFASLGASPHLLTTPSQLHTVDRLVLPGVGNFAECMQRLRAGAWIDALRLEVLESMRPLLGICVGMQMLADAGSEGTTDGEGVPGLGLVPGRVTHLRTLGCSQRVPHVGWNAVVPSRPGDPLFDGIPGGTDFYFVHSYAFQPSDPATTLATTDCGVPVTAAVRQRHVWGTQFHPEKSSRAGFQLLRNFLGMPAC
jgi:glutamine amidotransferase